MNEDQKYHTRTELFLTCCAVAMGLMYFLAMSLLKAPMVAAESIPAKDVGALLQKIAPHILLFLLGAGFGWIGAWLVERRGLASWVPVVAFDVISMAVAVALSLLLIAPLPKTAPFAFAAAAIAFLSAALFRQKMES